MALSQRASHSKAGGGGVKAELYLQACWIDDLPARVVLLCLFWRLVSIRVSIVGAMITYDRTSWTEHSVHHSSEPGHRSSLLAAGHSRSSCGAQSWSRPAPSGSSECYLLGVGPSSLSDWSFVQVEVHLFVTNLVFLDVILQLWHHELWLTRFPG